MDSRMNLHPTCRRILSGHQAMTPLTEEDEDVPEEIPTPITGLPEPIPGSAFWEKLKIPSPDASSEDSHTGSNTDMSVDGSNSLWNVSVGSLPTPKISSGLSMDNPDDNLGTRLSKSRVGNAYVEGKVMDLNQMNLHPDCRRILSGHQAMTSLTEEDEDAPEEIPTPITGLPEPIPGSAFWEKLEIPSPDASSEDSHTGSNTDKSVDGNNSLWNVSVASFSTPKMSSGICLDGLDEDIKAQFMELRSTNVHLEGKVISLNKCIDQMNGNFDDCLNRIVFLEERLAMAHVEVDFYRKLFETVKRKGVDTKFVGTDPLLDVDPEVKSLIDERLAIISRPPTPEVMTESPISHMEPEQKEYEHRVGTPVLFFESGVEADILRIEHLSASPTYDDFEENEKLDVGAIESVSQQSASEMDTSNIEDEKKIGDHSLKLMLESPRHLLNNTQDTTASMNDFDGETKAKSVCTSPNENPDCHLGSPSSCEEKPKPLKGSRSSRTPRSQKNTPRAECSHPSLNLKDSVAVPATCLDDLAIKDTALSKELEDRLSQRDQFVTELKVIDNVLNLGHRQSPIQDIIDLRKTESPEKDSKHIATSKKCLDLPPLKNITEGYSGDCFSKYNKLPPLKKEPLVKCTPEQQTAGELKNHSLQKTDESPIRDLCNGPKETLRDKSQFLLHLGLSTKERITVPKAERKDDLTPKPKIHEEKPSSRRVSKTIKSVSDKDESAVMKRKGMPPSKKSGKVPLKRNPGLLPTVITKSKEEPKIGFEMKGIVLPKIKTTATASQRGKLMNKMKVAPLPNLMKVTPAPAKAFLPKPKTVEQSKRPFIGKSRQLPPVIDLFVDFNKRKD